MHIFNTQDERIVFFFICLTASVLSFIISCYCTKEKAKIVQFYFETKSVVLTQKRFRAHKVKNGLPGTLSFSLLYIRVESVSNLQKSFSGRKKVDQNSRKDPNNLHDR